MLSTADADERLRERAAAPSRRSGAATGPSAASRWRWTRSSCYPDTVLAVAIAPDGSVGGFLQLVPSPASEGYSLASMRRRRDTPNGLMEYLITETVAWAREHAVTELSLNFAVFADFLRADEDAARWTRASALGAPEGGPPLPGRALHSFNRKFFPHWRRRYFCFERWRRLPARRSRLPPRRVAADPARTLGQDAGPGRAMRRPRRSARRCSRACSSRRRSRAPGAPAGPDWSRFGYDAARHNAAPASGDHRGERRQARAAAGQAGRHRRLLADLPARRDGAGSDARRLLRHDHVRQDRGDRRCERQGRSGAFTPPSYARLARLGADHQLHACRCDRSLARSTHRLRTAGSASYESPTARCSGRRRSRATRRTRR